LSHRPFLQIFKGNVPIFAPVFYNLGRASQGFTIISISVSSPNISFKIIIILLIIRMHPTSKMNHFQKSIVSILVAICITGAFGIPLGSPKFLVQALFLEFSFVALAIITAKNFRYSYIPNFIIAAIVILGNTISTKHIEIMTTLHPFYNAIVLIVGGYVLQGLLLITNTLAYKKHKQVISNNKTT
jgi:hypothetical protein